jgi:hypothetical protein
MSSQHKDRNHASPQTKRNLITGSDEGGDHDMSKNTCILCGVKIGEGNDLRRFCSNDCFKAWMACMQQSMIESKDIISRRYNLRPPSLKDVRKNTMDMWDN